MSNRINSEVRDLDDVRRALQQVDCALQRQGATGSAAASGEAKFIVLEEDATLREERVLKVTDGLHKTDAGAGLDLTLRTKSFVFFTAITGSGTITGETYESNTIPASKVLTAFTSDNDDITLTVEIHAMSEAWQPDNIRVYGAGATQVISEKQSWTQVASTRIWTETVNLTDADTSGTITVETSDGAKAVVAYTRDINPPAVLAAAFDTHASTTGGDPLVQNAQTETTSVDGNQTVRITGTTESHATRLWVTAAGISSSEQGPYTISGGTFDITATVRSSGNTGAQTATLEAAVGVTGTRGTSASTSNTVTISHTQPNLALSSVTYPGTQFALKDAENATITITDSNRDAGDSTAWDDDGKADFDDGGPMAIGDSDALVDAGTYAPSTWNGGVKVVERQATNYRDSGTNVQVTAVRLAKNGTSDSLQILVKIAHTAPTLTVDFDSSGNPARLRSRATGGDKTYGLTLQSDQELAATPAVSRDATDNDASTVAIPALSGSAPDKTWTATMTVKESDKKNTAAASYTWASPTGTNGAGKTTTTLSDAPSFESDGKSTYTVGGFEQRDIAVAQFVETSAIGTQVSNNDNANKLVCEIPEYGKTLTYVGSVTPTTDGFTITNSGGTFDADGDHVRILDSNLYNPAAYTVRIEEQI